MTRPQIGPPEYGHRTAAQTLARDRALVEGVRELCIKNAMKAWREHTNPAGGDVADCIRSADADSLLAQLYARSECSAWDGTGRATAPLHDTGPARGEWFADDTRGGDDPSLTMDEENA